MRITALIPWVVASAVIGAAEPPAWAGSAQEALKLYQQRRYDEAAKRWQDALEKHPDDPVVQYDLGATLYRQGEYQPAAEAFNHSLSSAGDSLRSRIAYNLGNSRYRQGQAKESSSPDDAMPLYQQALDAYQTAIQQDPRDVDAKFNYELTQQRLKQLSAKARQSQSQQAQASKSQSKESPSQQASEAQRSGSEQAQQEQASAPQLSDRQAEQRQAQQGQQSEPQSGQQGQPQEPQAAQSGTPSQEESGQTEASAQEPQSGDPSSKTPGSAASAGGDGSKTPKTDAGTPGAPEQDAHTLSRQQALWILDAIQQEERNVPARPNGQAQERTPEHDW